MKRIIFVAVALFCWIGAKAQVGTVVSRTIHTTTTTRVVEIDNSEYNRLSIGYASYKYKLGGAHSWLKDKVENLQYDASPGFVAEYIHGWNLMKSQPLYFESGLAFQFNVDYDLHFAFDVPLDVTYRYTHANGLYAAPFVGLNIGSNFIDGVLYEIDDDYSDCKEKFIQLGYNIGANFGYKRLNVGIGYRGDFTPSLVSEDDGNVKTGTFYLGLGVNF